MMELLFLLGFTLHNIEEALWLPGWSHNAKKFHPPVGENEFRFAVVMITAAGYLVTFQYFLFSSCCLLSRYIYLGFILVMVVNAAIPHLAATVVLRKYAPGTATGLLLNVPIGMYIIVIAVRESADFGYIALAGIAVALFMLLLICDK